MRNFPRGKNRAGCGGRAMLPLLLWLVCLGLAAPEQLAAQASGGHLICAGSGSCLPIVRVLVSAFRKSHPGWDIQVPSSIGSASGIQAAASGAIAIGLISRPLKSQERELGLTLCNFARTPMVLGVNRTVAEENITHQELLDIYTGKKRSWRDGRDIVVLTREPGDSSIEVLEKGIAGFREVYRESQRAKRWTVLLKDQVMNETLAKTPHAIGLSDLGAITVEGHPIKPLKVNGVSPTLIHLQSGRYPLAKTLGFVYLRGKLPPGAGEFLAFTRSPAGSRLLRANGYLPEP